MPVWLSSPELMHGSVRQKEMKVCKAGLVTQE